MALVRYEPWDVVSKLRSDIDRLFEGSNVRSADESSSATADWIPAVDIDEYRDRFVLHVDVPGVDPEGIDVTLEGGVLTIKGARARQVEEAELARQRIERGQGKFYRRFILPDTVDAERVKAKGRNGVLEIEIPKQPKAQPRRIEVA